MKVAWDGEECALWVECKQARKLQREKSWDEVKLTELAAVHVHVFCPSSPIFWKSVLKMYPQIQIKI